MSKTIVTTRATTWDTSSSATFTDTFILSNLGPLTTTFTPASDCLNTWYATSVHLELGAQSRTDCFPPGFTPGNYHTSGYYSPGLCPASYTAAKSLDLWWTAPGESGVQCCPIGYWLPAAVTASCFTPLSSTITTRVTDGTIVRTVVLSEIWAPAIPVLWKGLVDLPVVTTASGTNPSSTTTGPSPAGSVSRSPPGTSPTVTSTVGDTSGAAHPTASQPNHSTTIAIATAIPLVLIALFIAAFIFLRRRRARQNAAATTGLTDACLPELEGNAAHVHKPGAPFWPAPIELPTIPAPIELPTRPAQPVELPAVGSPPSLPVETRHVPGDPATPPPDVIVAVAGRLGDAMAQPTA